MLNLLMLVLLLVVRAGYVFAGYALSNIEGPAAYAFTAFILAVCVAVEIGLARATADAP